NGRFLCACFTRLSGRFPSVLRFRLYQILAVLISAGAFRPFGFCAVPTLPDPFGVSAFRFRPLLERGGRPAFAFRPFRLYQIRFPVRFRPESVSDDCRRGLPFGCSDFIRSVLPI
ncbi:hypothetical protein, partial [Streptomyces chrestomyceticus]|uniref:hypothetical protein n=1 Tax=Streptomyces chrestomyceticus TaxID=68185 RepID=UPI0035A902D6